LDVYGNLASVGGVEGLGDGSGEAKSDVLAEGDGGTNRERFEVDSRATLKRKFQFTQNPFRKKKKKAL